MDRHISVHVKETGGLLKVDPPEITVSPGFSVEWIAEDDDVTIGIPVAEIFGRDEIEIKKGGSGTLEVAPVAPEGRFTYAVFCHGRRCFARANSHPVMIVKKP